MRNTGPRVDQRDMVNRGPRSETMSVGRPWRFQMWSRYKRATSWAPADLLHGIRLRILVRESTRTRMGSNPSD